MKIFILICAVVLLNGSCSRPIMEALGTHKLHDECFMLRKNGHYSSRILIMGVLPVPGSRGRYIRSNDTVYFVKKEKKNVFNTYGYGVIDSSDQEFSYRFGDMAELRSLNIRRWR